MKKILMALIISLVMYGNVYSMPQKPIDVWNNMMTTQDNLISSGNLSSAEFVLIDTVNYSKYLMTKGYSYDYLIESGLDLANLYNMEGKSNQAIQMYRYIQGKLNNSDYELRNQIDIRINNLDTTIQNSNKLREAEKTRSYMQSRQYRNSYDSSVFIGINDIIATTRSIMSLRRY